MELNDKALIDSTQAPKHKVLRWLSIFLVLAGVMLGIFYFFGPIAKVGNNFIWKYTFTKSLPRYQKYYNVSGHKYTIKETSTYALKDIGADLLLKKESKLNNLDINNNFVSSSLENARLGKSNQLEHAQYLQDKDLLKKDIERVYLKTLMETRILQRKSGTYVTVLFEYSSDMTTKEIVAKKQHAKDVMDKFHANILKNGFGESLKATIKEGTLSKDLVISAKNTVFTPYEKEQSQLLKTIFLTPTGSYTKPIEVQNGYVLAKIETTSPGKYASWEQYFNASIRKY